MTRRLAGRKVFFLFAAKIERSCQNGGLKHGRGRRDAADMVGNLANMTTTSLHTEPVDRVVSRIGRVRRRRCLYRQTWTEIALLLVVRMSKTGDSVHLCVRA